MKYIFIGNRKFVLEEMLKRDIDITIFVIKDTHLQRDTLLEGISYTIIDTKKQLLELLDSLTFDVLISNGCPYILPISKMKKKIYVNIHPSYLPDLKGIDPAHGSVLFKRDAGATCHIMTDQVDAGDIISRVKIPYSDDLDVSLVYQLSFIAEKQVFIDSLARKFIPTCEQEKRDDLIYYSKKPEDKIITFNESNEQLIAKIKAFNNKSQGCSFVYRGHEFKVYDIDIMHNVFLKEHSLLYEDNKIIFCYEDCIIIKKAGELLKLGKIAGPFEKLQINSYISDNLSE
jgi:methionyl-tRNA formyltransferase